MCSQGKWTGLFLRGKDQAFVNARSTNSRPVNLCKSGAPLRIVCNLNCLWYCQSRDRNGICISNMCEENTLFTCSHIIMSLKQISKSMQIRSERNNGACYHSDYYKPLVWGLIFSTLWAPLAVFHSLQFGQDQVCDIYCSLIVLWYLKDKESAKRLKREKINISSTRKTWENLFFHE